MTRNITIERYTAADEQAWNDFCATARNATFLFDRRFMDYHSQRFIDCSLIARNHRGKIVALLPADLTADGNTLRSHGGLTYGGWIVGARHTNASTMLGIWDSSIKWMSAKGISELVYKPLPHIYALRPADDDLYALFRFGAERTGCLISSAIDLTTTVKFNESSRQDVKRCAAAGLTCRELNADELPTFWNLLEECLAERHNARPVHSLAEMELISSRFPANIKLFGAIMPDSSIAAATLLFITPRVAHTQYIATSPAGRDIKAFPYLAQWLIEMFKNGPRYLDFGTSCTDNGRELNEGLLLQKSGLGASGVAHEIYTLRL